MLNAIEHVQNRDGEYYVTNTRVPVGVVIASWKRGAPPERIVEEFPTLSLADVYGVITYYLDHQKELDAHFTSVADEYERQRLLARAERPEFYTDLRQRIATWRTKQPSITDQHAQSSEEPPE
jgi:uncharacterized protein (DUF433 family)